MPGQPGEESEETSAAAPTFSGGMADEGNDVRSWDQEPSSAPPSDRPMTTHGYNGSFGGQSEMAPLRESSAKDKIMSFTADARLGAQVFRVKTGVDAKFQAVRESKPVASMLSRMGVKARHDGDEQTPRPDGEVPNMPSEDSSLRQRILHFHEIDSHLDQLLPALQDYQRHRQGLADAEARIGILLQEAGMRQPGTAVGQALQDCGLVHRQAAQRRLEAHEVEEKQVTSVMTMHTRQACMDCKRSVQAYEAARKELRVVLEAREKARSTKKQLIESGANKVESKLAPHVEAAAEQAESDAKQRLQATTDAVRAKLAMLEAKHQLDYNNSMGFNMKNLAEEEQAIAGFSANISTAVTNIQDSAKDATLKTS